MIFDEEKILNIAKKAKEVGVELFVLDDGWFGTRNDDYQGLGDWFVNKNKLPNGIFRTFPQDRGDGTEISVSG